MTYIKLPIKFKRKVIGFTLVDPEFQYLDKYNWQLTWNGYAQTRIDGKRTRLHRIVMDAQPGNFVDHISLDKLDNRRSNLRFATHAENKWNKPKQSNNTSGFKGVYWNKQKCKWGAKLNKMSKQIHLGFFTDVLDAAKAYDQGAFLHFGEFANLNFKKRNK